MQKKKKLNKAKQYKHMTFYEAADMAKRAEVKELWLTHFSPSLVRAEDYIPGAGYFRKCIPWQRWKECGINI